MGRLYAQFQVLALPLPSLAGASKACFHKSILQQLLDCSILPVMAGTGGSGSQDVQCQRREHSRDKMGTMLPMGAPEEA